MNKTKYDNLSIEYILCCFEVHNDRVLLHNGHVVGFENDIHVKNEDIDGGK